MIGGEYNIGEFMFINGFPFMVKREHFKPMREHITKRMKSETFEEAFFKICTKYPGKYSQFDLMGHYLWFHYRDHYSWHLVDWRVSLHPGFSSLISTHPDVLKMHRPIQGVMKNGYHHVFDDIIFKLIGDYYCAVSIFTFSELIEKFH